MRNKKRYTAAIDPDMHNSGVAVYDHELLMWIFHEAVPNENVVDELERLMRPDEAVVWVEAGWLNSQSNFSYRKIDDVRKSNRISKNVGYNQQSGLMLVKMLKKAGFEVMEQKPLAKPNFKNKGKWTQSGRELLERLTGIKARINDDTRDAILIAFYHAQDRMISR